MEFKCFYGAPFFHRACRINRIRLEFKFHRVFTVDGHESVLIESDWNLNKMLPGLFRHLQAVLIESDWNLNVKNESQQPVEGQGINRIRLEFK